MSQFHRLAIAACATFLVACGGAESADSGGSTSAQADASQPRAERLEHLLSTLAADSMEGRGTGTEGNARAARFLAAELARYGVEPAGDDGFYQTVPLARARTHGGSIRRRHGNFSPQSKID